MWRVETSCSDVATVGLYQQGCVSESERASEVLYLRCFQERATKGFCVYPRFQTMPQAICVQLKGRPQNENHARLHAFST